jgi:hypothetical protein
VDYIVGVRRSADISLRDAIVIDEMVLYVCAGAGMANQSEN